MSNIQELWESTVYESIRMGLMTLQGGMSLRCGWYSTTAMEAGSAQTKLRKLPLPCPVDHMSLLLST